MAVTLCYDPYIFPQKSHSNIQETRLSQGLTSVHDLSEHLELSLGVEGDEVHAPVPAEVAPIEPVPVLQAENGLILKT